MNIGCASCGQIDCTHSDPVYLGIYPSLPVAAFASHNPAAATLLTGGVVPLPSPVTSSIIARATARRIAFGAV